MDISQWLSLLGICLLGAMSPGPSLAVVLKSTVHSGRPAGYTAAIAHGVGVALYGLLTITGLAALITQTPSVYVALQVLGALYLIYLGVKSWRSHGPANVEERPAMPARNAALEGFLTAFLNPKLAVFMLALFSQFLQPDFGTHEKAIMVATVGVTDAIWYCLVVTMLSHNTFLATLQRSAQIIDRVFGVILLALALSVLGNALL
jgi:threonine/homoserine/homoserine lactone efflux protein